ncbi:sensor domain-containing diguanylate cyclase [Altericroceibacterium spongiae]|nr:sensor domain-containing diguanylate cyclase [Altericroceibacterium spongiae]
MLRIAAWPVVAGFAYYVLAFVSLHFARGDEGIVTVWPASGLFVAALLLAREKVLRFSIVGAISIASTVSNMSAGTPLDAALGFTICNLSEALLVSWLIFHGRRRPFSFNDISDVGRFALASVTGALWSACFVALILRDWNIGFFVSWFTTVTLGIMIVTPVVVLVARSATARNLKITTEQFVRAVCYLLLVLAVSCAVFLQSRFPLLFVPLFTVLIATYRLGALGAATSVCIIAAVGSVATALGLGPIHLIDGNYETAVLFFQFYLLTLLASALPLSASLAQRQRMLAGIQRSHSLLRMAERTADLGHWHLNFATNELFWSSQVYAIHGQTEDTYRPELETALDLYHPDDREEISGRVNSSFAKGESFDFDARIVRPDGEVRHINTRGEAETDETGHVIGMFGVFQDITHRVETLRELDDERRRATEEAQQARLLSETDQLTGIGNRRKAMAVIEAAIGEANSHNTPLSIAIMDIDHFKSINDRFGHSAGDEVLKRITRVCSCSLREKDFIGRLGGEEFVVVLPGTSAKEALTVCERVRCTIEQIDWKPLVLPSVTASIGVASCTGNYDDSDHLLNEADKALYAAKQAGRNRLSARAA